MSTNRTNSPLRSALLCGVAAAALALVLAPASTFAAQVIAPDNGFGTATMPPPSEDYQGNQMQIVNGFLPGTTIDINNPLWGNFAAVVEIPGGALGGTTSTYNSDMALQLTGTGTLLGYNRLINLTLANGAQARIDSAPRVPFAPVQSFDTDLVFLFGQLPPGDPDFDLLRISAGDGFGLPSPGHTTLTDLGGGNWNVDSFFDITYRIDFIGHSPGPFGGMSGSTTGTAHYEMGITLPEPATFGLAAVGVVGLVVAARRRRNG